MSFKSEQASRHAQLSAYCAEGNTEARDRMIRSIERASGERQKGYRLLAGIAVVGAGGAVLLHIAAWLFGFDVP